MSRAARVLTWNGKDMPAELRELPAGRYVLRAVDEKAPPLTPDEEAGLEAALDSYRQGRVVDFEARQQDHRCGSWPVTVTHTEEAVDPRDAILTERPGVPA